jgi:hypothetical protein
MAEKLLVLRAWADTSTSGFYSALHPTGCPTLIPIPETKPLRTHRPPCFMNPECMLSPCTARRLADYMPRRYVLHNDPRLDHGFYTGYYAPRGRIPRMISGGDVVLFAAGLAKEQVLGEKQWRSLAVLAAKGLAGIYLVGGILIEHIIDVSDLGWSRALAMYPRLVFSPHYWRRWDAPVALTGKGFWVLPPLPLSGGSLREASAEARRLLGSSVAESFARSRFRRTRLLSMGFARFVETLESLGYRVAKPRGYPCTTRCLQRQG